MVVHRDVDPDAVYWQFTNSLSQPRKVANEDPFPRGV
jgi:hypothetical protein